MPSLPRISPPESRVPGVEECWAALDGHRMRYLRAGSGPPLLLIHGLLGYSFSWRFNFEALGRLRTVYAVDLLGVGYSDAPVVDFGLDAAAERMLQFASSLGLDSFDLLGTSHGGALAMRTAELAAERGAPEIRSLILVAPANPWAPLTSPLLPLVRSRAGRGLVRFIAPRVLVIHNYALRRMYGDKSRIRPGTVEGYAAPLRQEGALAYVGKILDSWLSDLDLVAGDLKRIRNLPTLFIWGDRDVVIAPRSAEKLRPHFDRAELVMLPGVGHLPYEEVPDDFNRIVTGFLENRR